MIPRPLQKYLFYIILFILVIGIVFISTKYMLQRFFPKIEGFDVPDGPGLTLYSNTTTGLAPGITRFLTGGMSQTLGTGSSSISHTYYGIKLTEEMITDINNWEPFINYFHAIATGTDATDEKIPALVLTNGGTNSAGWYVSTPQYGKITEKQLRRISGPVADRIVRVVYLMINAEIVRVEQATFSNYPQNGPLITGTYDSQYGGKNCMNGNGTLCSGAKVYSGFSDYIRDGDNGALRHWRADFIQTKLPRDWIENKPKILALKTYSKLYDENPDFASNYLSHTPEVGAYAEGAGMTVAMLLGGNLGAALLFNIMYREVIEELVDESGKVIGRQMGARGIIPALKGIGGTLKASTDKGKLLANLGKGLVSRIAAQTAKIKEITTLLRSARSGQEAIKDAAIVSRTGKLGLKMLAAAGRTGAVLKELAFIALGFDKSIKTVKIAVVSAKAIEITAETIKAADLAIDAAKAATTSLSALKVGFRAALASNPIGWGIAIVMGLADFIFMVIDLIPKDKFAEEGIKNANMIIADHMLKCPMGTMDAISLADEEFFSIYSSLPLPANLAVQDIAMQKRLSCVYTDVLGSTIMSKKVQCPEGDTETCFAEAPLPIKVWPAIPEPVSRLTVLDLLEKISDEIDNLSSDYITITGYEWAAVTAVNTMKSRLAANSSDFVSSYNTAIDACNLVQYGKISAATARAAATAAAAAAVAARARANAATGSALGSALRAAIAAEAASAAAEAAAMAAGTGAASYGTEWLKEGRSSYNAWWSDISGAVRSTNVISVNALTTPKNSDNFATRMAKNPFNWGNTLRHAPRFHIVADIASVGCGKYPNVNITASKMLSIEKDNAYNSAVIGSTVPPDNTRYLCQPMDFYRTIKATIITAALRKEIETMKAEMDKYPDLIGKFAEDPNLGDTSLSEIQTAAALTAANASVEDAAAGRATPSTTAARDAAVNAAVSSYTTALNAYYPVNIAYTTLGSFSAKINAAVWLTKLANEATNAVGGIYDISNTRILTSAGLTFDELDARPAYISKYSTDVSGAYWNKKTIINADSSTRQVKAIAAWTEIKTDFSTANDPYAMTTIQWLLANTVAARVDATATAAEKTAAAKRYTDALIPFQGTPSSPMNTIITNIITQLAATNKSAAVTSSNDFLAKFNKFVSEISYRNDDLEKDKNAAYISSITADAARIGYTAWKSKYIKTAIEMDALSTAKSILYGLQTDGKKAAVIKNVTDTRAEYIAQLINYHKYEDTRDYYINAINCPGWIDPFIYETDPSFTADFVRQITFGLVSAAKERYDGTRRGKVYGIPIMQKACPWFLTPAGASRVITALNAGKTAIDDLIAAATPSSSDISSYGAPPTIGWEWNSGTECQTITLNRSPAGLEATGGNVWDGSTRGEYTWTAQKCMDNPPLKRFNMQAMLTDIPGDSAKELRKKNYFKDVGGANCTEPGAQTYETPCVAGKEFQGGALCYENCPAGKWQTGLYCYDDCPAGKSPNAVYTSCIDNCGDARVGTQDHPIVQSDLQCKQACEPQDLEYALACYAPCTNGWDTVNGTKNCRRNACDAAGTPGGFVDEGTPGFCHKKCAQPGEYASAYAITDSANKVSCIRQCSFDNNDGANLSLVNVSPINAPTEIANCLAWLDATVGFTNGGTRWNSASASLGYTMTVGGGPSLVANQLFPGSKNVLQLSKTQTLSMTPVPNEAAFTMFFVSRQIGPTYGRVFMSEPNQLYGYWGSTKNSLHMNNWQVGPYASPATTTGANTTWDSYRIRRKASGAGDMARFGSSLGSFTTSAIGLSGLYVNKWEESEAQIAEIIIYKRDLTDTECQQVENYLLAKWFRQRVRVPGLQRCYYGCDAGWTLNTTVGSCEKNSCDAGQWENGTRCYDPCGADRDAGGAGSLTCYLRAAPAGYHDNVPGVDGNFAQDCPYWKQLQHASKVTCVDNCPSGTTFDGVLTCNTSFTDIGSKVIDTNVAGCPGGWWDDRVTTCYEPWTGGGCNWGGCWGGSGGRTQGKLSYSCNDSRYPVRNNMRCYENCPAGQSMRTLGRCTSDAQMKSVAGTEQTMPTIPKGIARTSRLKFQSETNNKWESRAITDKSVYWARDNRAKDQTVERRQTKTIGTKGRNEVRRGRTIQPPVHGVLTTGGCACVIATAYDRVNNGCGIFGRTVQYPVAPWGVAAWQVNTADATVQTLIGRLADLYVANPSLLPDELFQEDPALQGQGTPVMDRFPTMIPTPGWKATTSNESPTLIEDISMKSRLIRAYFDYTDALNYQDDIALICSAGYIETLITDELGEPALDTPGSGNSYLSRARMMYLMALGTNDEEFKSYLTRYDKWKTDTQIAMSERALAVGGTFIDPFSNTFLDTLAQYFFDQTKILLRGQFFHITKIFGLGYICESCVELHCNMNQYAAPAGTADAEIPKNLTITPMTNWIVRFYLDKGVPTAYEFQNTNANAFMLTNKRCLYYSKNYVPVVYFNGYTHTCGGTDDLQKQVEFYRKQNNKVNVKYITAQKDITADQTLCAMQWQESDYNPNTNMDGTNMVSKSGAFIWLRKGMPETPMKNSDGTYNFAYSPTKKNANGKDVYADTETLVTGVILAIKDGVGKGNYAYSETVVTGVLLTPTEISTEVFNRINDTDSATEKQSIMTGATKAMISITPPLAVATKLYKDEEDLEGCYPMKCSNPYVMDLILTKFNGATDPEGGTSKIITIKKIFTVNGRRCDMLANVISSTGVVSEQKRSVSMVPVAGKACQYTVSAIGAVGTGTFITDSLAALPPKTSAMITYEAGYGALLKDPKSAGTIASITGGLDTTRKGLEGVAKAARLKSYAASGHEKKFADCPTISCSSQDVLNAIVMKYNEDNYPKTTTNVIRKTMTKIFKVGTSSSVAGTATCDINFENTSQFYTAFPGTTGGAANKTTITKRFQVTTTDTCKYTVVSDITPNTKTVQILTDTLSVLEDDPSFDTLAIVANKPSTTNSLAMTVTRDTSALSSTGPCPTPIFTADGILLDIVRYITAQNTARAMNITTVYKPATTVSPTSCSLRVGYTRNGTQTAYMNTFTVSFTKDITTCRYRITGLIVGTETAATAGAVAVSSLVRPLNSCPSVPITCTTNAIQNEAKSFYKSMMTMLTNGTANTMNIVKAAAAGTNTCEFQVSTQSGTTTSAWDNTAANFSKFHFTFKFNPSPACDGINYVAYDMAPVTSLQTSHIAGDKVPENVACYSVLECSNSGIQTKVINALNAAAPSGTVYAIDPTVKPVKTTALNKCEYLVTRKVGTAATTIQSSLSSYDSTLHRSVVFKAKVPIVVKRATMSDADYTLALKTACAGMDVSGTVDPVAQSSSRTYTPKVCPLIGTTSTRQTVFPHSTINVALVAALRAKYDELKTNGMLTILFMKGGAFPVTQINSITVDTTNPARIVVPGVNYQRYEYRVELNVGLALATTRSAAKNPAGNYNVKQSDTDYAWNPCLHPVIDIFFYNTCTTPVISKENITFLVEARESMYKTF
jgi:hypothetical protein